MSPRRGLAPQVGLLRSPRDRGEHRFEQAAWRCRRGRSWAETLLPGAGASAGRRRTRRCACSLGACGAGVGVLLLKGQVTCVSAPRSPKGRLRRAHRNTEAPAQGSRSEPPSARYRLGTMLLPQFVTRSKEKSRHNLLWQLFFSFLMEENFLKTGGHSFEI